MLVDFEQERVPGRDLVPSRSHVAEEPEIPVMELVTPLRKMFIPSTCRVSQRILVFVEVAGDVGVEESTRLAHKTSCYNYV